MKLYTSHRAPNPRRVRWVMAEKGIEDVEVIEVDILTGEHKTREYRTRVGVPHVPALELDDGTTVSESVAICRYLEALYPEPNLFGTDARNALGVDASLAARNIDGGTGPDAVQRQLAQARASLTR